MEVVRIAVAVLAVLAAVYLGLCLVLFLRQSSMVYFPLARVDQDPSAAGLAFEAVTLRAEDGVALDAWFVPCRGARGTVLVCHGNAGNIGHRLPAIALFHGLGLNVLIFDYRGYGRSQGRPSEIGTYRDARAAWAYLVRGRCLPPSRIAIVGRSLGGAVAAALAAEVRPAGLVLEATFTSLPALGARLYPWLPVRWLARYRYDTLSRLPRVACPVLVAHSPDDEMIPFDHGQRLFAAAREPKTFVALSGEHNAGEVLAAPGYRAALDIFFAQTLGAPY